MLLLCRQKVLITKSGRIFVQLFLSDFDYQKAANEVLNIEINGLKVIVEP